jgi:membrane protein
VVALFVAGAVLGTQAAPPGRPIGQGGPDAMWSILRRTVTEFRDDNLTDWAAALTYYSVLSIFPALIALAAILGLLGNQDTIDSLLEIVDDVGPASAVDTFRGPVETVVHHKGGAGLALAISLAVALWTASGYIGAFVRASNAIYGVEEGRSFWKLRPLQVGVALAMVLLLALVLVALVLTGPLASAVGDVIGISGTAVTIWQIAKWPMLVGVVVTMLASLYYAAPNVRQPSFRLMTPGSGLAVVVWIVASGAFAFYVANFGSYNKTYGSLAGAIVFLIWMWLSNVAVLLGAELNAEIERERQLKHGQTEAEEQIQLEPRSDPA